MCIIIYASFEYILHVFPSFRFFLLKINKIYELIVRFICFRSIFLKSTLQQCINIYYFHTNGTMFIWTHPIYSLFVWFVLGKLYNAVRQSSIEMKITPFLAYIQRHKKGQKIEVDICVRFVIPLNIKLMRLEVPNWNDCLQSN